VENQFELFQTVRELLLQPARADAIGRRGQALFEANLGAGRRTAEKIAATALALSPG
jgi:hypothetical protein